MGKYSAATRVWRNLAGAIITATAAEENTSVIVSACTAHEHCDLLLATFSREQCESLKKCISYCFITQIILHNSPYQSHAEMLWIFCFFAGLVSLKNSEADQLLEEILSYTKMAEAAFESSKQDKKNVIAKIDHHLESMRGGICWCCLIAICEHLDHKCTAETLQFNTSSKVWLKYCECIWSKVFIYFFCCSRRG